MVDRVAAVRRQLGATYDQTAEEGRQLSHDEAVSEAIDLVIKAAAVTAKHPTEQSVRVQTAVSPTLAAEAAGRFGLTARETEVLVCLAVRRTDQEISAELFISPRTVTTHVSSILRKLGVSSRREVARAIGGVSRSLGSSS